MQAVHLRTLRIQQGEEPLYKWDAEVGTFDGALWWLVPMTSIEPDSLPDALAPVLVGALGMAREAANDEQFRPDEQGSIGS